MISASNVIIKKYDILFAIFFAHKSRSYSVLHASQIEPIRQKPRTMAIPVTRDIGLNKLKNEPLNWFKSIENVGSVFSFSLPIENK